MTIILNHETSKSIELADFIDALHERGTDAHDKESLMEASDLLKQLYNNRDFLGQYIIGQLRDNTTFERNTAYNSQVLVLYSCPKFSIRVNVWPSVKDSVYKSSGHKLFSYTLPHNHNFNFLTLGYFGPGYLSEYYEVDYNKFTGYPGEKVELKFVEESYLTPGKIQLYEALSDVHKQLPPESLSISVNILEASQAVDLFEQNSFNLEKSTITDTLITSSNTEAILKIASVLKGDVSKGVLHHIIDNNPIDKYRYTAMTCLAEMADSQGEAIKILEYYLTNSDSLYIRKRLEGYVQTVLNAHEYFDKKRATYT